MKMSRREFGVLAGSVAALSAVPGWAALDDVLQSAFTSGERKIGGRLGAYVIDTQSNREWTHRGDELFAMCSTFKAIAAAAVLARVDAGAERLDATMPVTKGDIIDHAPECEKFVGREMTLAQLCEAAVTQSDNTAANLILRRLGGPQSITDFAQAHGDKVTRLDRMEPELNEAAIGDARDTTSPKAIAMLLRGCVEGDVLSGAGKARLVTWLVGNTTGDKRMRAGLPKAWRVGDKTGTGGTTGDIAVIWPAGRQPIFVAVYMAETDAGMDTRNAVFAQIGKAIGSVVRG